MSQVQSPGNLPVSEGAKRSSSRQRRQAGPWWETPAKPVAKFVGGLQFHKSTAKKRPASPKAEADEPAEDREENLADGPAAAAAPRTRSSPEWQPHPLSRASPGSRREAGAGQVRQLPAVLSAAVAPRDAVDADAQPARKQPVRTPAARKQRTNTAPAPDNENGASDAQPEAAARPDTASKPATTAKRHQADGVSPARSPAPLPTAQPAAEPRVRAAVQPPLVADDAPLAAAGPSARVAREIKPRSKRAPPQMPQAEPVAAPSARPKRATAQLAAQRIKGDPCAAPPDLFALPHMVRLRYALAVGEAMGREARNNEAAATSLLPSMTRGNPPRSEADADAAKPRSRKTARPQPAAVAKPQVLNEEEEEEEEEQSASEQDVEPRRPPVRSKIKPRKRHGRDVAVVKQAADEISDAVYSLMQMQQSPAAPAAAAVLRSAQRTTRRRAPEPEASVAPAVLPPAAPVDALPVADQPRGKISNKDKRLRSDAETKAEPASSVVPVGPSADDDVALQPTAKRQRRGAQAHSTNAVAARIPPVQEQPAPEDDQMQEAAPPSAAAAARSSRRSARTAKRDTPAGTGVGLPTNLAAVLEEAADEQLNEEPGASKGDSGAPLMLGKSKRRQGARAAAKAKRIDSSPEVSAWAPAPAEDAATADKVHAIAAAVAAAAMAVGAADAADAHEGDRAGGEGLHGGGEQDDDAEEEPASPMPAAGEEQLPAEEGEDGRLPAVSAAKQEVDKGQMAEGQEEGEEEVEEEEEEEKGGDGMQGQEEGEEQGQEADAADRAQGGQGAADKAEDEDAADLLAVPVSPSGAGNAAAAAEEEGPSPAEDEQLEDVNVGEDVNADAQMVEAGDAAVADNDADEQLGVEAELQAEEPAGSAGPVEGQGQAEDQVHAQAHEAAQPSAQHPATEVLQPNRARSNAPARQNGSPEASCAQSNPVVPRRSSGHSMQHMRKARRSSVAPLLPPFGTMSPLVRTQHGLGQDQGLENLDAHDEYEDIFMPMPPLSRAAQMQRGVPQQGSQPATWVPQPLPAGPNFATGGQHIAGTRTMRLPGLYDSQFGIQQQPKPPSRPSPGIPRTMPMGVQRFGMADTIAAIQARKQKAMLDAASASPLFMGDDYDPPVDEDEEMEEDLNTYLAGPSAQHGMAAARTTRRSHAGSSHHPYGRGPQAAQQAQLQQQQAAHQQQLLAQQQQLQDDWQDDEQVHQQWPQAHNTNRRAHQQEHQQVQHHQQQQQQQQPQQRHSDRAQVPQTQQRQPAGERAQHTMPPPGQARNLSIITTSAPSLMTVPSLKPGLQQQHQQQQQQQARSNLGAGPSNSSQHHTSSLVVPRLQVSLSAGQLPNRTSSGGAGGSRLLGNPTLQLLAQRAAAGVKAQARPGRPRKANVDTDGDDDDWTDEQSQALVSAYQQVDPTHPRFWQEVAAHVPGRSAGECFTRMMDRHKTPEEKAKMPRPLRQRGGGDDSDGNSEEEAGSSKLVQVAAPVGLGRKPTVAAMRRWTREQHQQMLLQRAAASGGRLPQDLAQALAEKDQKDKYITRFLRENGGWQKWQRTCRTGIDRRMNTELSSLQAAVQQGERQGTHVTLPPMANAIHAALHDMQDYEADMDDTGERDYYYGMDEDMEAALEAGSGAGHSGL